MATAQKKLLYTAPIQVTDFKALDSSDEFPSGALEGYASVFGNTDLGQDVVLKGAFKKTLKANLPKNRIKIVDSHNVHEGSPAIIGTVKMAKEDDHGLFFKGPLSSVQRAQDVRTKVKEGILDALSFGYSIVDSEFDDSKGIRYLKELSLYEVSVVPWGMNPEAALTGVKGVVGLSDMKLAPVDHPWDAAAAKDRVLAKIGGDPADWTDNDWKTYAKAFLWFDSKNYDKLGSYHLPVVDVVDGAMAYVFKGAASALAAIHGARGAGTGAWAADDSSIEGEIKSLYQKFDQTFPDKAGEMPAEVKVMLADMREMTAAIGFTNLLADMKSTIRR